MALDFKLKWLPLVSVALVLGIAGPASARATTTPPGNSAVNQYLETVPTASGNKPTTGAHGHGRGSHSSAGVTSGGGTGQGPGGGSAVSASTLRALRVRGTAGVAAAALAAANAPGAAATKAARAARARRVRSGTKGLGGRAPVSIPHSPSTAKALVDALTGSSNGGGLGSLLPVLLIAIAAGLAGFALVRRRRGPGPGSAT